MVDCSGHIICLCIFHSGVKIAVTEQEAEQERSGNLGKFCVRMSKLLFTVVCKLHSFFLCAGFVV